jgi:hypothetical protein
MNLWQWMQFVSWIKQIGWLAAINVGRDTAAAAYSPDVSLRRGLCQLSPPEARIASASFGPQLRRL